VDPEKLIPVKTLFSKLEPRTWLQEVWWWIRHGIWNWVGYRGELWRYIARFYQRGCKGYGACDVWDAHYHLADVISNMTQDLLKQVHGHPCDLKDLDEWKDILIKILWTFDTAKKISEGDWLYLPPEHRTEKEMRKLQKFAKDCENTHDKHKITYGIRYHVMDYYECEKFELGWKLFQKYFFGLWD
jgi:hypothetical protein